MTSPSIDASVASPQSALFEKRLDAIGWGLFLVLTGSFWLAPDRPWALAAWLMLTGVLLVGLNVVRRQSGLRVSGLITFIGVLALAAGLSDAFGIDLPIVALSLIVVGGSIILKAFGATRATSHHA